MSTTTVTYEASQAVRLFEPPKFNCFYYHAVHVGGGWWLCLRDRTWHNGIEFRLQHLPQAVDLSEAITARSSTPWIDGTVGPHNGMQVDPLVLHDGRSVEMWEAFARAMDGPLADYARRAVALPPWSHPHTKFYNYGW